MPEKIKKNDYPDKSNLIRLLSIFSPTEMREFGKFVNSPFHNNRRDVIKFFNEVKKYHPFPDNNDFSDEKVYSKLYPHKKFRPDVLRRLKSNLFRLGEDYIVYLAAKKNKIDYNKNLLEFYISKSSDNLYYKQQKKSEVFLEHQKMRDANYFLNINFLEENKRIFFSKNDTLAKKIDLQTQIDSVWKYSIITLFRLYRLAYDYNIYTNKKYNLKLLDEVFKIAEEPVFRNSKALKIWYEFLKFNTSLQKEEKSFYKLKSLLEKDITIFNKEDGFYIYIVLLNYCYDMNMYPGKNFLKEEFQIISQMLKNELLIQGNTIDSEWFMYAFLRALNAGEIHFAEQFVKDFISKVSKNERSNTSCFANASLEFSKKNFNASLKFLSVPAYNNLSEKLFANRLYLQIYYELGLNEPFFYTADSFKHLIEYESSFNTESKQTRLNFINFAVKLFRLKYKEIEISVKELKREIMASKVMGSKWLLEKLSEAEKAEKSS